MNSKNQIKNVVVLKKSRFIVCLMAILAIVLFSCSKEDRTTYKKISGTWYLINDPACKWTFDAFDYGCTNCYLPRLHINKLGNYGAMDCYYSIDNNTLWMNENPHTDGIRIVNSNLSIDDISKNYLRISGIIRLEKIHYDGGSYRVIEELEMDINHEFKKTK